MSSENQGVFTISSKSAFIFGIVAGLLLMGTVGFVILLSGKNQDSEGTVKSAQEAVINTNTNPTNQKTDLAAPSAGTKVTVSVDDSDHIRGNKNAPVTIVEYSDYECPYCSRFHPTMEKVMEDYGDQVRWVYKHFPLDSLHPEARPAALASECANELGGNDAFWSFTDAMFKNQANLGDELYKQTASDLGLDSAKFEECYSSKKYANRVQEDQQEGQSLGVQGTPASFVNGIMVSGAVPYESLKQTIDSELR